MASQWYDVDEVLPQVLRVNDGDLDSSYILLGAERTGVIDTGMGIGDLATIVANVSSARALVINTHAHPDHWQGNYQFEETSMSAVEWDLMQKQREAAQPSRGERRRTPLDFLKPSRRLPPEFDRDEYNPYRFVEPTRLWYEGDIIDLGGFKLEVILAPAHTLGSICLLERERRFLLSGDTVLYGTIWLHLNGSAAPNVAFDTYERLASYADAVDHVLPAHGTRILPGAFLADLQANAARIRAGEIEPRFMETFAGNGWFYDFGGYGMLFAEQIVPRRLTVAPDLLTPWRSRLEQAQNLGQARAVGQGIRYPEAGPTKATPPYMMEATRYAP